MPREMTIAKGFVAAVSRNYRVTADAAGLKFYRSFDDAPGVWHLEGSAPGVLAADWRTALERHLLG